MRSRTVKGEDENIRKRCCTQEAYEFFSRCCAWVSFFLTCFFPRKDFHTDICWTSVRSNHSSPTTCICVFYATVTTAKCVFKWNLSSYNPWASDVSFIQLQVAMKFSNKFFWEMWSYLRLQTCFTKSYSFTLSTKILISHIDQRDHPELCSRKFNLKCAEMERPCSNLVSRTRKCLLASVNNKIKGSKETPSVARSLRT